MFELFVRGRTASVGKCGAMTLDLKPVKVLGVALPQEKTMAKSKKLIGGLSERSLLILAAFQKLGSIEAIMDAIPGITAKDLEQCLRESKKALRFFDGIRSQKPKAGKTSRQAGGFQLKIVLEGSKPPIWRRVIVPADLTLDELHWVIQVAMGWENAHLHEFTIDGTPFGGTAPDETELEEMDCEDETCFQLSEVLREKLKFYYLYDFGDSWEHTITVEKIIPARAGRPETLCTAGKRRCPLEDSGGMHGYYEMLKAIADKKHPAHAEWYRARNIAPEAFDIQAVNSALARMKL